MRQDGKFMINGDIPEGQGSVTALLSECFDLAYELRTDAEREDEPDSDEDNGNGPDGHGQMHTKGGDHQSRRHKDLDGDSDADDDGDEADGEGEGFDDSSQRIQQALKDNTLVSDAGPVGETSKGVAALSLAAK